MKKLLFSFLVLLPGVFAAAQDEYVSFANAKIFERALKAGDTNHDNLLSREEAAAITELNLAMNRSDVFVIDSYEDLRKLPGLKKVWLGTTRLERVDLSGNPALEWIHIESPSIKTLILAHSCYPHLEMFQEWMGDPLPEPEIIRLAAPGPAVIDAPMEEAPDHAACDKKKEKKGCCKHSK